MKSNTASPNNTFSSRLLAWNSKMNKRKMPWKGEKDPYKIWLSEIILQQTRVEQGLNYYNNFIRTFPDVHKLARAPEAKVFKLWEGLGYYSRCRNLIASAKYISSVLKGKFPSAYEEIKALKGVGPYTAAAISSFAYNLPYAVVDGNVFRVLSRVFGINKPVDSTEGKKYFTGLAQELLDKKRPGIYNQAIMDFGAVVCKPAAPLCSTCVFNRQCVAYIKKQVGELPVKEKKITIKKRWFTYFILEYKNQVAIIQRTGKDIWQDLYEFPLAETTDETSPELILQQAEKNKWLPVKGYEIKAVSAIYKQQLSHQLIAGRFISILLRKKSVLPAGYKWIDRNKLNNYPFPKFINQYLQQKAMELALF